MPNGFDLIKVFSLLFKMLGLKGSRFLGAFLGFLFYYLIPIRKEVVLKNLSIAFPEKSLKEIKLIARKNYQSILITFLEFMCFPYQSANAMKSILEFPGQSIIYNTLAEKKGLIFWSGHLGSWEVAAVSGALRLGIPFHVLAKEQSNDSINKLMTKAREVHGNKMILLGVSVRHLIHVIKSNGIVAIVGDQRGPEHNPRVFFFGKPTSFYTGTATIIAKTNCNVIFAVAVREKNHNYKVIHQNLDQSKLPIDFDERIQEINQQYALFLEKTIRQFPEQYFWMHNLWKY